MKPWVLASPGTMSGRLPRRAAATGPSACLPGHGDVPVPDDGAREGTRRMHRRASTDGDAWIRSTVDSAKF